MSKRVFPVIFFSLILVLIFLIGCEMYDMNGLGNLVPLTVVEDPSLPSYTLNDGTKLHFETFGDPANPVLIILHGGPGGSYKTYLSFEAFKDNYYVIFWDQRGAGLSERVPNAELTGEQYLADLDELVEDFKRSPTDKVYIIGHSWGGAYASYYVNNYPQKVEKLVLMEPGPINPTAAKNTTGATFNFFDPAFQGAFLNTSDYITPANDAKADYFRMTMTYGSNPTADTMDWREGYRCNYQINDWRGLWDGTYTFNFTSNVQTDFTTKVLFIAGTSSETERIGKEFQEKYQSIYFTLFGGEIFTIEGATHGEIVTSELTIPRIREYFTNINE